MSDNRMLELLTGQARDQEIQNALERSAYLRCNRSNVSNPPTAAELTSAFGSPTTLGDGFVGLVDDNNAHTTGWLVFTLGGAWWRVSLTLTT